MLLPQVMCGVKEQRARLHPTLLFVASDQDLKPRVSNLGKRGEEVQLDKQLWGSLHYFSSLSKEEGLSPP